MLPSAHERKLSQRFVVSLRECEWRKAFETLLFARQTDAIN
jgi:hypothetical protein